MNTIDLDTSYFSSKYEKTFSTGTNCLKSILTIANYIVKPYCDTVIFPAEFINKAKSKYSFYEMINKYIKEFQEKYLDKITISTLNLQNFSFEITIDKAVYTFHIYPNNTYNNSALGKIDIKYYGFDSIILDDSLINSVKKCLNDMVSSSKFNIISSNHVYLVNKGFINSEYSIVNKILSNNIFSIDNEITHVSI